MGSIMPASFLFCSRSISSTSLRSLLADGFQSSTAFILVFWSSWRLRCICRCSDRIGGLSRLCRCTLCSFINMHCIFRQSHSLRIHESISSSLCYLCGAFCSPNSSKSNTHRMFSNITFISNRSCIFALLDGIFLRGVCSNIGSFYFLLSNC